MTTPLGNLLKHLREQKGLTQDELGAKIDRTRQRIECIENRLKKPPVTEVLLIIGALELNSEERREVYELANIPQEGPLDSREVMDDLLEARKLINSAIGKLYKGK